jgi:odorant receptor
MTCKNNFHISQVSTLDNFSIAASLMSYLTVMLLSIFTPCYYGNEVAIAAANLNSSVIKSPWLIKSKKFKSAMMIFTENTRKPTNVKTGFGVFKVDLTTFLWICNSAYSVFSVLKSFN